MATQSHRVEIQIDDHCFTALNEEAQRLGVELEHVVQRAMSAWLSDMCESESGAAAVAVQAD